jgi:hypothetical protein
MLIVLVRLLKCACCAVMLVSSCSFLHSLLLETLCLSAPWLLPGCCDPLLQGHNKLHSGSWAWFQLVVSTCYRVRQLEQDKWYQGVQPLHQAWHPHMIPAPAPLLLYLRQALTLALRLHEPNLAWVSLNHDAPCSF